MDHLLVSISVKPISIQVAPAGTLIYIPANSPHTLVAFPDDEDVIFLALKDLSQGIIGKAVDGTMSGPLYKKGFEPGAR